MTDHRMEGPGEHGTPIPRDLPDQQAHEGEDQWDAGPAAGGGDEDDGAEPGSDVPDTDEAGTGRHGTPRSDTVHPEHPGAEESSG
ncbi:hypothetical protein ACFV6E_35685 [Streptomyces sp. NPDC059785]|uniref:hypothetical protein n=1 Tax=unclassified Streptomyces TaxID=2593676 RepID=UPI00366318C9